MRLYTENGIWILIYNLETKRTFQNFAEAKEYCINNNLPFNFEISEVGL